MYILVCKNLTEEASLGTRPDPQHILLLFRRQTISKRHAHTHTHTQNKRNFTHQTDTAVRQLLKRSWAAHTGLENESVWHEVSTHTHTKLQNNTTGQTSIYIWRSAGDGTTRSRRQQQTFRRSPLLPLSRKLRVTCQTTRRATCVNTSHNRSQTRDNQHMTTK